MGKAYLTICLIVFSPALVFASQARLDVRLVTDEPEAVLSVLAKKKSNQYNEAATIYNRKAKEHLALWSDVVLNLK